MTRSLSRGTRGAELSRLRWRVQVAKGPTAPVEEALGRFAKAAAAAESADPKPEAEAQPEPRPQPGPQEEVQDEAWALRMRAQVEAHKPARNLLADDEPAEGDKP